VLGEKAAEQLCSLGLWLGRYGHLARSVSLDVDEYSIDASVAASTAANMLPLCFRLAQQSATPFTLQSFECFFYHSPSMLYQLPTGSLTRLVFIGAPYGIEGDLSSPSHAKALASLTNLRHLVLHIDMPDGFEWPVAYLQAVEALTQLTYLELDEAAAEDAPNEAADAGSTSSSPIYRDLFDKVLLDAPCSGTGVLAKRSDLRWRRTLEEVQGLAQLQGELLPAAAKFVKPGGVLVYSTCCLEQEENEDRVAAFLASEAGQDFELEPPAKGSMPEGVITKEGYLLVLPHEHDMDGAFAARLRRKVQ